MIRTLFSKSRINNLIGKSIKIHLKNDEIIKLKKIDLEEITIQKNIQKIRLEDSYQSVVFHDFADENFIFNYRNDGIFTIHDRDIRQISIIPPVFSNTFITNRNSAIRYFKDTVQHKPMIHGEIHTELHINKEHVFENILSIDIEQDNVVITGENFKLKVGNCVYLDDKTKLKEGDIDVIKIINKR